MTPPNDDPHDTPKPLEYGHAEQRGSAAAATALLLAGALVGAVTTIVVGAIVGGVIAGATGTHARWGLGAVAVMAFVGAAVLFVRYALVRRQAKPSWLFCGFLLGCGVLALLQGVCYTALALQQ